jgi:sulfate permease, SulP family
MKGDELYIMIALIVITIGIIYLLPKVTKLIPSTLAAILIVSIGAAYFHIDTKTVGYMGSIEGGLPIFHIPEVPFNFETLSIIFPYSLILAAVGLIESLLTLNLIDDMTETRGKPNKESIAQGASNLICGFFGGMGGCAMIGQSMININNGALKRLSGIATGVFLLSFILFLSDLIEMIPLAALIGVMFVVAEKTFEWGSLRLFGRVPKKDIFVVVLVAVVTVFFDLAIAVIIGVIISALAFAWQHAKQIKAVTSTDKRGWKVYKLQGSLFFASISGFNSIFDYHKDPNDIVIDFEDAKVMDHSALVAIDSLAERYQSANKTLHLRHLSPDCYELLKNAKGMVEVNLVEDPKYHIADDKIS